MRNIREINNYWLLCLQYRYRDSIDINHKIRLCNMKWIADIWSIFNIIIVFSFRNLNSWNSKLIIIKALTWKIAHNKIMQTRIFLLRKMWAQCTGMVMNQQKLLYKSLLLQLNISSCVIVYFEFANNGFMR